MSYIKDKFYKISPVIFVGLLFALILLSGCTDKSEPPVTPASTQTSAVPVTIVTTGTPGASVTMKIPTTTNTPKNPACSSGQTLCDGSCVDTQSDRQHCGKCGNVCNESEPCSEGTCLSWTGSWKRDDGWVYKLTQTGTSVSGTNDYNNVIISGSTSGNPPRLIGILTWQKSGNSDPLTLDMAPDGKSFFGGIPGKNILTFFRELE
ncbi:Stigma-specific protein, Stig1 [Methanoregula sp.]|uniref:Stigma-specific protein, Stig1 n=1 Tax=Methanoregula sp. TaxID=2052170 RepID=UPI002611B149|nr:Stigma-specific protein, Stig1 [Methanoregula sp.]MDD5143764.1 Stigma-specific protein, Stig1 [Methanoregula sp.]